MRHIFPMAAIIFLVACTTVKPAPNAFKDAEEAIAAADQAGAEEHSPVELRFAREKLAEAREGMERKSYEKAIYLIEQSEINSELAIEKTRTALLRAQVAGLQRDIEIMKEDFQATYGETFE